MDLCNPSNVRTLLDKYGLAPQKGYGQNFLINRSIPARIAECSASYIDSSSAAPSGVLEIGPGVGALTQELCQRYDHVAAVEIDHGLIPLLNESLAEYDNVTITEADFMKLDLHSYMKEQFGSIIDAGGTVSVCANLPYYITTPVLMKLLESYPLTEKLPFSSIVIMIQLEVARRFSAPAGSDDYGAITASIMLRCNTERLFDVSPGNFLPAPKVSSAVVGLIPHNGIREVFPAAPENNNECLAFAQEVEKVISLAFGQRRKTLVNALSSRYPKDQTIFALNQCGFRTDLRGEKLSATDFCALTAALLKL